MQGRNRDTDVKTGLRDAAGEGEGGANGERSTGLYPLPCVTETARGELRRDTERSAALCDGPEGRARLLLRGRLKRQAARVYL